jgi:hypothetical protein
MGGGKTAFQNKGDRPKIRTSWKILLVFFVAVGLVVIYVVAFTDIAKNLPRQFQIYNLKPTASPSPSEIPTQIDPEQRKKLIREGYF